jgi:hypothetical protein
MAARPGENFVRWDRLFADLESRAAALARAERSAEVNERSRIEAGRLTLSDRLAANQGRELVLRLVGGLAVAGELTASGADWLLVLDGTAAHCLIFRERVCAVMGLDRWTAAPSPSAEGQGRSLALGVGHALRALSLDRVRVTAHLVDGSALSGTIDRVGKDFVDVSPQDGVEGLPRARALGVTAVPYDSISMIRHSA